MRRLACVVALAFLLLPACKGKRRDEPAGGGTGTGTGTGTAAPVADAAERGAPPDLSFIKGDVVVVEKRDGHDRPVRLDPATGAWTALGGGDANLFPTGHRLRGGLLAIATWGETEADHVEQLAIVRGAEVELFGPRAQMIRNPSVAGEAVLVESSEASFRDLYAIGADGKATRLTDNPQGNFEPAVSPDGKRVAFASSRDGNAELYVMPVGGGEATRLTNKERDDWSVAWSPDGTRLVFLSDRDSAQRVYVMAPDGTGLARLTAETAPDVVEEQPRWSPDGKTLAYLRGERASLGVVLVEVATGKARTLTPAGQVDLDYAWSPDGAHLVVVRHPDRNPQSPGAIAFVRVSDGAVLATDDTTSSAVRWIAP